MRLAGLPQLGWTRAWKLSMPPAFAEWLLLAGAIPPAEDQEAAAFEQGAAANRGQEKMQVSDLKDSDLPEKLIEISLYAPLVRQRMRTWRCRRPRWQVFASKMCCCAAVVEASL